MTKHKTILPQYRILNQDNELYALQIKSVKKSYNIFGSLKKVVITPREEGYEPFEVCCKLFQAYDPQPGWYLVRIFGITTFTGNFWFDSSTSQVNSGS